VRIETLRDAGEGRWAAAVRIGGESVSGAPWDHLWGYTFEMRDGRIKSFRAYFEPARAFDAVGLTAETSGG
jgi:ketosteroid isomerase-like protein